jgi:hypothetical protein
MATGKKQPEMRHCNPKSQTGLGVTFTALQGVQDEKTRVSKHEALSKSQEVVQLDATARPQPPANVEYQQGRFQTVKIS